jgi:hypothetical protein
VLRRQRIHTCFNLLVFDPDSTLESIRTNVDFMRRQSWFPLNFCRTEVYGGTPLEARLRREGRLEGDWRGYTYTMTDPRAQAAFELFRHLFWPRNFAFDGTHFGSMKLDYCYHLLGHFFPELATAALEERVKGLVHELNRHSASLMDRVLDFAASERRADEAAAAELLERLERERVEVDRSLGARMDAEVRLMEALAAARPDRRGFIRAASVTAVSAAAAVALGASGCDHHHADTHMCEAPPPPPNDLIQPVVRRPYEDAPSMDPATAEAVRQAIQAVIDAELWPALRAQLPAGGVFELRIAFDGPGQLALVIQNNGDQIIGEALARELRGRPQVFANIVQQPWNVTLIGPLTWPASPDLLEQGEGARLPDTHMCEAPPPPPHLRK